MQCRVFFSSPTSCGRRVASSGFPCATVIKWKHKQFIFFVFLQFFFKLLCTRRSIRSGSARFAWELRALSPVAFGVAKMLLTNWQTFWLFCFLLGCSPVFLNLHLFYSAEQVMRTKKEGGTRNKINIFAVVQKGNWELRRKNGNP